MQKLANTLIYVAGILWTIETIPQIYTLIKTKKTDGISLTFFIMCICAYIIFITGNIILKHWSVVVAHLFPFINLSIILYLVFKYRGKKDLYIGEIKTRKCPKCNNEYYGEKDE